MEFCLIIGAAIIGYAFPEWLAIFRREPVKIPIGHNLMLALAFGLIAAWAVFR